FPTSCAYRQLAVTPRTSSPFPDPAPPDIHTLSLHDALPICSPQVWRQLHAEQLQLHAGRILGADFDRNHAWYTCGFGYQIKVYLDRKSTRLNSSHVSISYAVFCLKKKKSHDNKMSTHQHHSL